MHEYVIGCLKIFQDSPWIVNPADAQGPYKGGVVFVQNPCPSSQYFKWSLKAFGTSYKVNVM